MPHTDAFYAWKARVQALFSDLLPHHRAALAEYSFGAALARCIGLTSVVAYLADHLLVKPHALAQRLREFYRPASAMRGTARSEFDHALCFEPLLRWAAAGHPSRRLVIALDPTNLADRWRVLCAAVLYRGVGLPVAWSAQAAADKGDWNDIWVGLLTRIKAELGDGWTVYVLTDRGLESAGLFRAITDLGFHPLMRVKAAGHFRPEGWHKGRPMRDFAAAPGRRFSARGVAYPGSARLGCTLLAEWGEGHAEPWLVLTDLDPRAADCAWYAWRMWVEQGFRAVKRGQWQWHKTQVSSADRVARQWAVLAVATIWMVELGGEGEAAKVPAVPAQRPRPLGALKVGLMRLFRALVAREPLPQGRLRNCEWTVREWINDPLTEDMMNRC